MNETQPWAVEYVRECVRQAWSCHRRMLETIQLHRWNEGTQFWRGCRDNRLRSARAYFIAGHKISLKGLRGS